MIWAFGDNHKNLPTLGKFRMWNALHHKRFNVACTYLNKHEIVRYRLALMLEEWEKYKRIEKDFHAKYD